MWSGKTKFNTLMMDMFHAKVFHVNAEASRAFQPAAFLDKTSMSIWCDLEFIPDTVSAFTAKDFNRAKCLKVNLLNPLPQRTIVKRYIPFI